MAKRAQIKVQKDIKPTKIDKFLGLNISNTGDTQIQLGESGNMDNFDITDDYKLHAVTDEQSLVDAGNDYVTRRELPTKGGVLTAEMIEREGFSNLADALRAKATSLVIDGAGNVTIRGVNSIGNHANALIICDGMEIGSINAININDVASVEIQRDGTLYGFKGVGGVIAIKTKSGSKR